MTLIEGSQTYILSQTHILLYRRNGKMELRLSRGTAGSWFSTDPGGRSSAVGVPRPRFSESHS